MERLDNLQQVAAHVDHCRDASEKGDSELAHMHEKAAWRIALDAIVSGDDRAVEIATLARSTVNFPFMRVYA